MGVEFLGNANDPAYQEKLRAKAAAEAQQPQAQPLGPAGPAPEQPNIIADVGAGLGSGMLRGATGILGTPADIMGAVTDLYDFADRKLRTGETREAQQARLKAGGAIMTDDLRRDAGSEMYIKAASDAVPALAPALNFAPQTWPGRIAQVGGEGVGGAGPLGFAGIVSKTAPRAEKIATLVKELVGQGLAPGVASEAAGQIADNYLPEEWATAVRAVTGVGTAVATGTMHNVTGPPNRVAIPGVQGDVRSTAAAHVGKGIEAEGGPGAVQQQLTDVGPGGVLADAGPNLRGQAVQTNIEPGPSMGTVRGFLNRRAGEMQGSRDTRLNTVLDTLFEPRERNFAEESATQSQARRDRANDLYGVARERAGNNPIDVQPFNDLADSLRPPPDPTTNQPRANYPLRDYEGTIIDTAERLRGRNDFDFVLSQKRDMDAEIRRRSIAGEHVPQPLIDAQRTLDESLERATRNPDGTSSYAAARNAYSEDSQILARRAEGQNFFDTKERPGEFQMRWREMTDDQQQAFRMGLRESIADTMDTANNDFVVGTNKLRQTGNQEKLVMVMGRDEAERLQTAIEGLRRQRGTSQDIVAQSATEGRKRGRSMIERTDEPVKMLPLSRVQTLGGAASLAAETGIEKTAGRWLSNRKRVRAEDSNVDQARMLTQDLDALPPEQRLAMLQRLHEVYGQQGQRGVPANRVLLGLQSLYQTERSEENKPPLTFSVRGRKQ